MLCTHWCSSSGVRCCSAAPQVQLLAHFFDVFRIAIRVVVPHVSASGAAPFLSVELCDVGLTGGVRAAKHGLSAVAVEGAQALA